VALEQAQAVMLVPLVVNLDLGTLLHSVALVVVPVELAAKAAFLHTLLLA
jgi:hypothetical protein